ncbi:MAG: phospho-N-acetylmuramoyl-pentapeptide-transferase [Anaerolineales bacterium]|nr:phospho-N-acetylmuramoyl-pentapeptide-transferase [Anaerolineales bacterium]
MQQSSTALALAGLSFMMTVIWGGPLIRILKYFKIGESIRIENPERHQTKMGTPTMGGVMVILPVIFITGLMNAVSLIGLDVIGRSILLPLGVMILYGALGALDDWQGIRGNGVVKGLRGRTKFLVQVLIAVGAAFVLEFLLDVPHLFLPGIQTEIDLGILYIPIAMFLVVGFTNAVNLTDGLDGLAGLISATAFAAFGFIALLQGQVFLASFCFTLVGALFGFLWFNVHPAELFMGDTGALALGGTLAVVALMTGQWPLLILIAIIPVSEALSVIIQVGYFKITGGQRIFKMSPLHYHFELLGWSETQIVQRFWLIGLLFAMIGVALAVV